MSRLVKILIGLLTLTPIAVGLLVYKLFHPFMNLIDATAVGGNAQRQADKAMDAMLASVPGILLVSAVLVLIAFCVLVFYLVNIMKNPRVPQANRTLWALVLLLSYTFYPLSLIVMLTYFFTYIWPDETTRSTVVSEGAAS